MLRLIAIICSLAALAGAAQAHEAPDFGATAHTVAILSLLGDDVEAPSGVPIAAPDAGFDGLVETAMARQIATDLPGAAVVRVGGPRDVLLHQMYYTRGFGDIGMTTVRETLRSWAGAHPVDYVVIFRKTTGITDGRSWDQTPYFGIGVDRGTPVAFLNITVCDGRTLEIIADLSARDVKWGSIAYTFTDPKSAQIPVLVDDARVMLGGMVPGLVHGVGL